MQATTVQQQAPLTDQFTAARIAAVLGRDVRELRRVLADREPDGHCLVSGNLTRTYLVSSLPETIRLGLAELASKRGFDCSERLLARDTERWEHPVPVAEIHPEEITRAQKRASTLAPWAQAYSDGSRPASEVLEQAQLSHKQALGFTVTAETMENLFRRVIGRDGGRGEFERWALYLPEMPKEIRNAQIAVADAGRFDHFESYIAGINPAALTLENRAWAWTGACDNYQLLLEQGENPRRARRELVTHIFAQAPWLCASKQSLGKCFDEKWRRYCAGERFLADGRPERSGHRRNLPLTEEDKKLLIAHALVNGRGLSAAWDNARREGALSPAVRDHFIANPASKSYVPSRIRAELAPEIETLRPMHHGPRQAKLNGAYITRDWSDTSPADWYQADDTTLPLYYWEEDEKGCAHILRGQFLPMIDLRTNRALAFALHSERNYTAAVIRGLILRTHDSYGLPRCGFYFENGIWRKAKIIKGVSTSGNCIDPTETESGLREWGVRFRHAKPGNARAKKVERIIGLLQDRMEDQPGYCGRIEQTEKFERVQRNKLDVEAGREHPGKFFLHRDEWIERLATICELYNDEPQEGALAGKSPRAAWDALFDHTKPLIKLSADTRWLLANHRALIKVTHNGITIRASGRDWVFRNESTARLINRIVHVFYNPEDLSSCFVKLHPSDDTAAVIPLVPDVPATTATREQLDAAQASVASHNRAIHTRYREIAAHFPKNAPSPFRPVIADAGTVEAGREIAEQQEKFRAEQAGRKRQQQKLTNYAQRFGRVTGSESVSTERRLKMNKLVEEAARDEHHT